MEMPLSNPNLDTDKRLDKLLIEQSSELLEAVQDSGESERQALADWLTRSPRHTRAHLFMSALEEELEQLDPDRKIPIPDVRGDVTEAREIPRLPAVVGSLRSCRRERGGRRWFWGAAAAVLIVVAAGACYSPAMDYLNGWRSFDTAIGEQRSVSLSDGSIVQLNTGTRIKARISAEARDIRLLKGEALFKVAQDRSRPFEVTTADAAILAVGTQFNVYQLDGRTKVSVLEGRVRVTAADEPAATSMGPIVTAGQEVEVHQGRKSIQRAGSDVASAAAWVQRRVVFKQEPLANVLTQFNRYRRTPRLRVDDPALAARKYSGTFDVDDPRSLEDVLSNETDVALERTGDEIVIRKR
jgi:transmembrane sensor